MFVSVSLQMIYIAKVAQTRTLTISTILTLRSVFLVGDRILVLDGHPT